MTVLDVSDGPARRVMIQQFAQEPLEAIEEHSVLETYDPPAPSQLKPSEVLVSIRSASVGWVDLLMTSGLYQHMAQPPYCPGLEYSGVVAHKGDEVDHVEVGDEVIVDAFVVGPRTSGAYREYGGFASYALAPSHAILPLPAGFTLDQGCQLLGNYETAYHCLIACGDLQPGETVLIHGASGSTGLAAVHIAKLRGATVIATGRSDEKLAVVQAQGADHILNTRGEEGQGVKRFRDDVKALTDGRGVDVVYDGVGGAISLESMRCVKFGARFLIVGWAATPFVAKGRTKGKTPNPNMLPTNLIMMKGLKVLGCPTVIATQHDPSIRKERLDTLMQWAAEGKLKPHISHTFPLDAYKEAMRTKWEGRVIGGCVLHPHTD